jgi:hypothetical protein
MGSLAEKLDAQAVVSFDDLDEYEPIERLDFEV